MRGASCCNGFYSLCHRENMTSNGFHIDIGNKECVSMNRIIVNAENALDCSGSLHDAACEKWTFDYESKTLTMNVRCERDKSAFRNVIFEGVYAHNMVSCGYWGPSPYLFGIELITPGSSGLYKQIIDYIQNAPYDNPFEDKMNELYEAKVQFTSGDVLSVLCQHVIIAS